MKILICTNKLPPIAGGAEQVAWETAKRLSRINGIRVQILINGKFGTELKEGIKIRKIPYKNPVIPYLSIIKGRYIERFIEKEKFDVIHTHLILPWGFVLRNCKSKMIISCHGEEGSFLEINNYLRKKLDRLLNNIALNKAIEVIVPSKWLSKDIQKWYNLKSKILPNGIDAKKFRPIKNIKQRKNVILFVGRYVELKGIRELLAVAKELPKYEFWFVGKGPLENEIEGSNIENLGFKTQEELIEIYNKATICAFPSYRESFGITALEAMACGKAIIATKLGFSEIIKNGREGLIIKPKNKKELKNAIIKLMENSKLKKKFEKNARKKALKYDWDKIIKRYYMLYLELLRI